MNHPRHNVYGSFELSRAIDASGGGGVNAAMAHIPHENFPCSACVIELVEPQLGDRAWRALEDEALGFGPLFDLQYSLAMGWEEDYR